MLRSACELRPAHTLPAWRDGRVRTSLVVGLECTLAHLEDRVGARCPTASRTRLQPDGVIGPAVRGGACGGHGSKAPVPVSPLRAPLPSGRPVSRRSPGLSARGSRRARGLCCAAAGAAGAVRAGGGGPAVPLLVLEGPRMFSVRCEFACNEIVFVFLSSYSFFATSVRAGSKSALTDQWH